MRGIGFWFWVAAGALSPGIVTAASADAPVILVVGDSLSAAYGIDARQGWVQLMADRLEAQGFPHRVVNSSVSGETSSGGLARLPGLLERHAPGLVLIELGGNDGLRGLPVPRLADNLRQMVTLSRDAGAKPVLFEMQIPSNYGATYTERFTASFAEVADAEDVPLVPFFLAEIATDPDAFLPDGIHPGEAAQPILLDAVWPHLKPLLAP